MDVSAERMTLMQDTTMWTCPTSGPQSASRRHPLHSVAPAPPCPVSTGARSLGVGMPTLMLTLNRSIWPFSSACSGCELPSAGATVRLTTVETDRGVSWAVAKQRFDEAKAAGREGYFLISRSAPFGYPRSSQKRTASRRWAYASFSMSRSLATPRV